MTRENKVGIAVSCTFLGLVGAVVWFKTREAPAESDANAVPVASMPPFEMGDNNPIPGEPSGSASSGANTRLLDLPGNNPPAPKPTDKSNQDLKPPRDNWDATMSLLVQNQPFTAAGYLNRFAMGPKKGSLASGQPGSTSPVSFVPHEPGLDPPSPALEPKTSTPDATPVPPLVDGRGTGELNPPPYARTVGLPASTPEAGPQEPRSSTAEAMPLPAGRGAPEPRAASQGTGPIKIDPPSAVAADRVPPMDTSGAPKAIDPPAPPDRVPADLPHSQFTPAPDAGTTPARLPPIADPPGSSALSPMPAPPARPAPTIASVKVSSEEGYSSNPGDTFAKISTLKYGSDVYANALQEYNRNHVYARYSLNGDGTLTPKARLIIPSVADLEEKHGSLIVQAAAPGAVRRAVAISVPPTPAPPPAAPPTITPSTAAPVPKPATTPSPSVPAPAPYRPGG